MVAWVRRTVSTIFFVDWSMTSWSYAFRRMRIFCLSAISALTFQGSLGGSAPRPPALRRGSRRRGGGVGNCVAAKPPRGWPGAEAPSRLLEDLGDAAGAHGPATLTNGEPQPLIHGDRMDQLHRHRRVVTRHAHLHPVRQLDRPRHIGGPEIELRTIIREERLVTAPLLLRQHVHL